MGDHVRVTKLLMMMLALVLVLAACSPAEDVEEPALPDDTGDTDDTGTDVAQDEPPPAQTAGNGLLADVEARGSVVCGVNDAVPGFGSIDADGANVGFDIDFCRAIAAAIFDDPDAVEYRTLTAAERFTALQSGEIDVLIRNTTATATRDGSEGAAFATTTYYDGQGMMVRAADGFESIDDMANTVVCVLEGTTTELNLASRFTNIPYEPRTFTENDDLQDAFIQELCDGWTSDVSQLSARRSAFPEDAGGPDSLVIFEEVFSKEPLGPAVRDGDSQWFDVVNWVVMATIQAEEFGIASDNVDGFADTENPDIQRFLGLPVGEDATIFDPGLGLPTDFAQRIVRHVGNYGEIYDRHLGPATPLGLSRGVNTLWTEGGLLYAWPYR
jgi:general L-amino acid transport system substrate-binding protein